jgi:hypothetical protein
MSVKSSIINAIYLVTILKATAGLAGQDNSHDRRFCEALASHIQEGSATNEGGPDNFRWHMYKSQWVKPTIPLQSNEISELEKEMIAGKSPEAVKDAVNNKHKSGEDIYRFKGKNDQLIIINTQGTLYCQSMIVITNPTSPSANISSEKGLGCWDEVAYPLEILDTPKIIIHDNSTGSHSYQVFSSDYKQKTCQLDMKYDTGFKVSEKRCDEEMCHALTDHVQSLAKAYKKLSSGIDKNPYIQYATEVPAGEFDDIYLKNFSTSYSGLSQTAPYIFQFGGEKYFVVVGNASFAWRQIGDVNIAVVKTIQDKKEIIGGFHINWLSVGKPHIVIK